MQLFFRDGRLERRCRTHLSREQSWGAYSSLVARLLFELYAVANLADAALLPGVQLHPDGVTGRYRVTWASGVELIIRPIRPGGEHPDASADLRSVGTVVVEDIGILVTKEVSS